MYTCFLFPPLLREKPGSPTTGRRELKSYKEKETHNIHIHARALLLFSCCAAAAVAAVAAVLLLLFFTLDVLEKSGEAVEKESQFRVRRQYLSISIHTELLFCAVSTFFNIVRVTNCWKLHKQSARRFDIQLPPMFTCSWNMSVRLLWHLSPCVRATV